MIQKVTDPSKIVTDPVLLKDPAKIVTDKLLLRRLAEQGINPNHVEFCQDYAKHGVGKSPYMKGYRHLLSGGRWSVFSSLPMVDAYGFRHELAWREKNGILENGSNIFKCFIDKGTIRLITLSDQPNGLKKDDEGQYHPQLFIGSSEIQPSSPIPIILATDPTNPNYHDNVILWNYDTVCRRRIRLIPGGYRERWLIDKHPHSRVRIKHNISGRIQLKLGSAMDAKGNILKVTIIGDEEIIVASEFDKVVFPVEIGASDTFYPTAGANSPVDGYVLHDQANQTFHTLVVGAGNGSSDVSADFYVMFLQSYDDVEWNQVGRSIFLFDLNSIAGAIISAITQSLHGSALIKQDLLICTPNVNIYSSAPANNDALVNGDYTTLGTAPYCDTPVTYPGWSQVAYNDFIFNATGIAAAQAAVDGDGILKTGARNAEYDVADELDPNNHDPNHPGSSKLSGYSCYYADQGSDKPKLVVTYTLVAKPPTFSLDPKPRKRVKFYPSLKLG